MGEKAGPPTGAMEPLLQPSAPPAEMPIQHPPAPPSYNEAMGWTPQQPSTTGGVYPPLPPAGAGPSPAPYPQQPVALGHRPLTNVTANPIQPASQPVYPGGGVVVVQQVMPTSVVLVGPKPVKVDCPACHASIKTTTEITNKTLAHITCLLCLCFGCWPCCWVPYCLASCKHVKHSCPNCKSYLGTYDG